MVRTNETGPSRFSIPREGILEYWDIRNGLIGNIGLLTVLRSSIPANANPTVQQVKGAGFAGAGSATVAGLLTTDTITATGDTPTCSVNGTLTFGVDFDGWDIYVHRAGVLWAYWPGVNVGQSRELDASGNGHHITALTTTIITERVDGSGTNYANEEGYSDYENIFATVAAVPNPLRFSVSGPDDEGFYTYTKIDTTLFAGIPIKASPVKADTTTYTVRLVLRKLPSSSNTMLNGALNDGATTGCTGRIVSGPGVISNPYMIRVTGLSETVDTVLEISKNTFQIGIDDVQFDFYPCIENSVTIGDGVKIKQLQLCRGVAPLSDYCPPALSKTRATRSVKGGYPQSLGNVVCIGDSLTAGYIPYLRLLHQNSTFIDKGVSGNMSSQLLARFAADTAGADHIIILIGINDVRSDLSAAYTMANITACVDLANAAGRGVSLCELSPFGNEVLWSAPRQACLEGVNGLINAYGEANGIPVANLYNVMRAPGTDDLATVYDSGDGLHFNAAGSATQAWLFGALLPATYSATTDLLGCPVINHGPLRNDLIVTVGDTYPALTVKAPLGPKCQVITEWTNNAAVDLSTLVATANTRLGTRGVAIWNPGLDAAGIVRADRVLKPSS